MCNYKILDFWILDFSIFKISDIGLLWSKITIFIIDISLKLHLHTNSGWNNPNSCRSKILFFAISDSSKMNCTLKHSNTCHWVNFHCSVFFFEMRITMSSIRINNSWNYQKTLITEGMIPFKKAFFMENS